ncbi:heat shock protein DnaJ [Musa troglodytarum]|uniref:Heat shock protein DnaJ n=1 Tax=Musa troglodytarum TaxID=320322 RepID=A0A9E7L6D5_9LILI|nr:heat shock protein DnaJ [Musa troglodytarum]URE42186.1 heat shock protein DnaJ [Musa troglodytarum]URE42191.1 heat shock protein DnaJ [Musa troglodytarum]
MGGIDLFKQGCVWVQFQKQDFVSDRVAASHAVEKLTTLIDRHWPLVYSWCTIVAMFLFRLLLRWRDCVARGLGSLFTLGTTALFVILWSCLVCLTSMTSIVCAILSLGAAATFIHYLGFTPGLSIIGPCGILIMWIYGYFWLMAMLLIAGVKIPPTKEAEDAVYSKSFCTITKASNLSNAKKDASSSKVVIMEPTSLVEMERIMNSSNHYEVLGLLRNKSVDHNILKKEYHKKVLLVHPDKNMGSSLACESFKKLQCAYEVLSDLTKKKNYDEQLRKEEHGREYQRPSVISQQEGQSSILKNLGVLSAQSVEILIYGYAPTEVNPGQGGVRAMLSLKLDYNILFQQDCSQYHQAKDGDGWVESGCQPVVMTLQKMEIPRAFVCAESKVFDVSEWAICQGMTCRSNTHGPSFHVNMVALDSTGLRSNSSTYSWGLDAKLVVEDDEFELWLQEALASGIFSETPKRRKSWPFKINQKGMKPWRRSP